MRNQLMSHYGGAVEIEARRIHRRLPPSVDVDDLISRGHMGLMEAVERFDPKRGHTFEAFYMKRVRGAINDELRDLDHLPRSWRRLEKQGQKVPGLGSLDAPLSRCDGNKHRNLLNQIADTKAANARDHKQGELREFINVHLRRRESLIMILLYIEGLSMREIGKTIGVDQSRISQIHKQALEILRAKLQGMN